ncbi:sarcoplasmic calcium-binding protein-like [Liolophura sinensis]|uniref:sarcoplasmic calcium-binding protein-like n=1 Tax=Liolophura sinensis TaxID=3198878 RepID=UPI003158EF6B
MAIPENLIQKWTKIFNYRDTDNDGVVRETDFEGYTRHFIQIYGPKAEPVLEINKILWGTMTAKEYKPEITLPEFLDNYTYLWTQDRCGLEEKLKRYTNLCFDAIDTNGDGGISLAEYSVYQNSFGITNHDYIEHIFKQIDVDDNGVISREEFVGEVLEFVLSEDKEAIPDMYDHHKAKTFRK